MITIDVYVPVTGKTYDFLLDENILVETVTEEITELILQREGYSSQETTDIYLFSESRQKALNTQYSLKENGIDSGDKLLLV